MTNTIGIIFPRFIRKFIRVIIMKQIKTNLHYMILIIWIYINFITNIFSMFLSGSLPSLLKYIILFLSGIVLLLKYNFRIKKKVIVFSVAYFIILLLNILLVNYDRYVIIEGLTSFVILIIPIYVFSQDDFNLQSFNSYWYSLRKYIFPIILATFILYKFSFLKYSVFDNIVLPTLLIMCFQYNKNNSKNMFEFLMMLFLLAVQVLFGGRMAGLSAIFIFILCLIFVRNNTLKKKIIYSVSLLLLISLILFNLPHILNFLLDIFNALGIKVRTLTLLKQQIAEGGLYLTNRDYIYIAASDFVIRNFGLPGGFAVVRGLTNGTYYHAHNLILNLFCFFGIYGTAIIVYCCFKQFIKLKKKDKYEFSFGITLLMFYLLRSMTGTYLLTSIYSLLIISLLFFQKEEVKPVKKKNIIITGGGTFNKGAQSMLFITVDECKKRFPDHELLVFSTNDYKKYSKEKNPYNFRFAPNNFFIKLYIQGGIFKFISKIYLLRKPNLLALAKDLECKYQSSELCIDISGFAVSSKFSWKTWIMYFLNILNAKRYNIPMYLMPQSFGPFDFSPVIKIMFMPLMKICLNYPKIIFCRELDGYKLLKDHVNSKLEISYDMVLLNKEVDLKNIYVEEYKEHKFSIKKHSVAIIPNQKLLNSHHEEELLKTYKGIINHLLKNEYNVYIVRHSFEDYDFCVKIKDLYKNNNKVFIMADDVNCIDFNDLVQKFDFIVGSRYHSIVHAYKNFVPCIVLGWAVKYERLLEGFEQSQYMFRVDKKSNYMIKQAINKMVDSAKVESKKIKNKLVEIQKQNIFSFLDIESSD